MHLTTKANALVLPLKETHAGRASGPSAKLCCLKILLLLECPQKKGIKKEMSLKESNMGAIPKTDNWLTAKVNGKSYNVLIDSGASVGVIPPRLAPTMEGKGRRVTLHGAVRGQRSTVKMKYEFGEKVIAVVSTELDDFKGVIFPWSVKNQEETELFIPKDSEEEVNGVTRAANKKAKEDQQGRTAQATPLLKEKDHKKRKAKEESATSTATTPVVKVAAPAAVVHYIIATPAVSRTTAVEEVDKITKGSSTEAAPGVVVDSPTDSTIGVTVESSTTSGSSTEPAQELVKKKREENKLEGSPTDLETEVTMTETGEMRKFMEELEPVIEGNERATFVAEV